MRNEADFQSSLGKDALLFRRLLAREELGRLPEYRIELLRPKDLEAIGATLLLGKSAGLHIRLAGGGVRQINGLVTRFEKGGATGRFDIYHVELRPWLWHLTLSADCRIFQEQTAVDIIQAVFANYQSATRLDNKLSGTFPKRPYTVQYRETDFNFVSRLMEEEGIYYYFAHDSGQHTLVLCDSPNGHSAMPGGGKMVWADPSEENLTKDNLILEWSHAHTLRSLKYSHTDFAAEAPTTALLASAQREAPYSRPNDLEVYDYPGGQDNLAMSTDTGGKVAEGKRTAEFRVRAFESAHSVAAGITQHRPLAVGSTFDFEGHPDAGGYLVVSSIAEMEFAGYEANDDRMSTSYSCRFDAVPQSVQFQPRRVAKAPLVHGPQTATVVGASGDEILTDKYGRVKVQFHWDREGQRDAQSSCWVRVSHPWASKQFGMVALPRVGDEVVVDFLEGNPDRPLVTGRVYNGDNMPPWALPAQATVTGIKSRSSKGGGADNFNELRFDDKKGSEYVWFQAEKDFHRLVKNDAYDTVKNNQHIEIVKNSTAKIGENTDTTVGKQAKLKIGTDAHVDIGGDWLTQTTGALGLQVTGAIAVKGAQSIALTSGQSLDVNVGQAAKLSANATVHIKANAGVVIDGGVTLTIKAGAGSVVLGPDGVSITGPIVKINSGGSPGAATAAAPASPPAPQAPKAPDANTDPLAG